MFVLDNTTRTLELILDGAVANNQLPYVTSYIDQFGGSEGSPGSKNGTSNSGTAVTIVAAPGREDVRRIIKFISVFNADTANRTVNIRLNDNSTTRIIASFVLATLEHLYYQDSVGFYAITTAGAIK